VYNQGWLGTYGETVIYRGSGPVRAAEYGAVAVLIESVAPFSLDTPHTGGTNYTDAVPKIPAACITKEDAEMLYRMYSRGNKLKS
jgi:carboxypeptidase Q